MPFLFHFSFQNDLKASGKIKVFKLITRRDEHAIMKMEDYLGATICLLFANSLILEIIRKERDKVKQTGKVYRVFGKLSFVRPRSDAQIDLSRESPVFILR